MPTISHSLDLNEVAQLLRDAAEPTSHYCDSCGTGADDPADEETGRRLVAAAHALEVLAPLHEAFVEAYTPERPEVPRTDAEIRRRTEATTALLAFLTPVSRTGRSRAANSDG